MGAISTFSFVSGCFAGLMGIAAAVLSVIPAWANSGWDYAVTRDDRGEPQAVYARVRGEGGSYLWLSCVKKVGADRQGLGVTEAATVAHRAYLGPSDAKGRSTVFWFDDGSPKVASWIYKDHYGQVTDAGRVRAFLKQLTAAEHLVVELSDYRYVSRSTEFRLEPNETKAVAERFSSDCRSLASN